MLASGIGTRLHISPRRLAKREREAAEQAQFRDALDAAAQRCRRQHAERDRAARPTTNPATWNDWPESRAMAVKAKPPPMYSTAPARLCAAWRAEPDTGDPGSQGNSAAPR